MKIIWTERRDHYFPELKIGEVFIPASDIVALEYKRVYIKVDTEHAFCLTENKMYTPGQQCSAFIVDAELVVSESSISHREEN